MKLVIARSARRRLKDLPPKTSRRLLARLEAIATDPLGHHPDVKPIKVEKDVFRLRAGDWRALYRLEREAQELRVDAIEPRGSVYR